MRCESNAQPCSLSITIGPNILLSSWSRTGHIQVLFPRVQFVSQWRGANYPCNDVLSMMPSMVLPRVGVPRSLRQTTEWPPENLKPSESPIGIVPRVSTARPARRDSLEEHPAKQRLLCSVTDAFYEKPLIRPGTDSRPSPRNLNRTDARAVSQEPVRLPAYSCSRIVKRSFSHIKL
jgi:hypothetical protein